ncbi:MAG: hypothetical protein ACTHPD_09765 [Rhizomicrobium sp.]
MTVAELRKALEGLPDDMLVLHSTDVGLDFVWQSQVISVSEYPEDTDHLGYGEEDETKSYPLCFVIS